MNPYIGSLKMFRAIQVIKHGGPEMMKVITSNELPQITSSQVLPFSLYLN